MNLLKLPSTTSLTIQADYTLTIIQRHLWPTIALDANDGSSNFILFSKQPSICCSHNARCSHISSHLSNENFDNSFIFSCYFEEVWIKLISGVYRFRNGSHWGCLQQVRKEMENFNKTLIMQNDRQSIQLQLYQ